MIQFHKVILELLSQEDSQNFIEYCKSNEDEIKEPSVLSLLDKILEKLKVQEEDEIALIIAYNLEYCIKEAFEIDDDDLKNYNLTDNFDNLYLQLFDSG